MTEALADSVRPTFIDLYPGSKFGGYRIVRLLGRGGMGAVYEAQQTSDGRVVAITHSLKPMLSEFPCH